MSSGFTGEGFQTFPPSYEDNKKVGVFSELSDLALGHKVGEYRAFAQRDDVMPRALETTARILTHANFEVDYRAGKYDAVIEEAKADGRYDQLVGETTASAPELATV